MGTVILILFRGSDKTHTRNK